MLVPSPASLDLIDFVSCYGKVYPGMPTLAKLIFSQQLTKADDDPHHLFKRFYHAAEALDVEEKLLLIKQYHTIKLFIPTSATFEADDSSLHQAAPSAPLFCNSSEFDTLQNLQNDYQKKFGFPFLFKKEGKNISDLITHFRDRLANAPETEFRLAFLHVHYFARRTLFRLNQENKPTET